MKLKRNIKDALQNLKYALLWCYGDLTFTIYCKVKCCFQKVIAPTGNTSGSTCRAALLNL